MSAVIANTAPRGSAALYRRRRITNVVAITLACAAALFGLAFLGWILWTLLAKGLAHLGPSLFTQDQPPPMEAGGLANDQRHGDGTAVHQQDVLQAYQNQLQEGQPHHGGRGRSLRF